MRGQHQQQEKMVWSLLLVVVVMVGSVVAIPVGLISSSRNDHHPSRYDPYHPSQHDHYSSHPSQKRGHQNDHYRSQNDHYGYQDDHKEYQSDDYHGYQSDDYHDYQSDDPQHDPRSEALKDDPITPPPGLNFTTPPPRPGSTLHAVKFMQKFGYVQMSGNDSDFLFTPNSLSEAIKRMQRFGGIEETGEVDNATLKLMQTPRCGLPDLDPKDILEERHRRPKRYIVGSDGWNKRRVTYYVANWSPQLLSKENVQKELRKAFDAWTTYSHLQFIESQNQDADIIIYFASFDHSDGYPFDGESGILAHAYYPYEFGSYGGDVHFDESETWTIEPEDDYSGLDFFTVAVHEIGHSLGLAHSPVQDSIMFPYYKGYKPHFALAYDDVMAMWELYIKRRLEGDDEYFNTTTTTTPRPSVPDTDHQSDAASDDDDDDDDDEDEATYDSSEEEEEESIYEKDRKRREEIEKRRQEERRAREEEEEQRRRREEIQRREEEIRRREEEERRRYEEEEEQWRRENEDWERNWGEEEGETNTPPSKPDAPPPSLCDGDFDAMAVLRQELFIFKGQYLWRYSERGVIVAGYPTKIQTLFPAIPTFVNRVDAVYERKSDSSIIFFVGKYYYVHDGDKLVEGSPRPLTDLGLPEFLTEIDAAFYWPRAAKTYIFTRNGYYRYNDTAKKMDPGYPKPMSKWNGLPQTIDTVFTWTDDQSYFLSGSQYWLYDNLHIRPSSGYPRSAPPVWAACPSSS